MRKHLHAWFLAALACVAVGVSPALAADKVTKYARFEINGKAAYGIVEGDKVQEISGNLFGDYKKTDKSYPLDSVKLLVPTEARQVFAMAGNYRSHLKDAEIPPKFQIVQPFLKPPACLIAQGEKIVIPKGTEDVHYEAELVVVIGKTAKNVKEADAMQYVFGVTCGNDVSARDWQKNDIQWWRAKGSDTFGPCGPYIVSGVNYGDLNMKLVLNGEVKQEQRTSDLIHSIAKTIAVISQHTTLLPGDLIFTGTPGKTSSIKPGDVVEVDIEKVGVLKNPVVAAE